MGICLQMCCKRNVHLKCISNRKEQIHMYTLCVERTHVRTYYNVAQLRYIIKWCDMWYTHIKFILRYFHLIKMIDDHHEYIWKNLYIYVYIYMLMIIINIFIIIMMFGLLLPLLLSRWHHWWLTDWLTDWTWLDPIRSIPTDYYNNGNNKSNKIMLMMMMMTIMNTKNYTNMMAVCNVISIVLN